MLLFHIFSSLSFLAATHDDALQGDATRRTPSASYAPVQFCRSGGGGLGGLGSASKFLYFRLITLTSRCYRHGWLRASVAWQRVFDSCDSWVRGPVSRASHVVSWGNGRRVACCLGLPLRLLASSVRGVCPAVKSTEWTGLSISWVSSWGRSLSCSLAMCCEGSVGRPACT